MKKKEDDIQGCVLMGTYHLYQVLDGDTLLHTGVSKCPPYVLHSFERKYDKSLTMKILFVTDDKTFAYSRRPTCLRQRRVKNKIIGDYSRDNTHYVYYLKDESGNRIYAGETKTPFGRMYNHLHHPKSKFYGRTDLTMEIMFSHHDKEVARTEEDKMRAAIGLIRERVYYQNNGSKQLKSYWSKFSSEERSQIMRERALGNTNRKHKIL